MPLWISDFLTSPRVELMGTHEIGAYLLLLMYQWRSANDRIPADAVKTITRWKGRPAGLDRVLQCFRRDDLGLYNDKASRIRAEREEYHRGQSDRGRQGGLSSRENGSDATSDGVSVAASKRASKSEAAFKAGEGEVFSPDSNADVLPSSGGGRGGGEGGPLAGLTEAPAWLLGLSAPKQRKLLAAANAKGVDLAAAALACEEWWNAHPTGKPARWFGRMDNWLKKAESQLEIPKARAFQPANTDPRRPVVEVDEP